MTTVISSTARPTDPDVRRHRRPLAAVAFAGGAVAAATTLAVCAVIGVIGWFAADSGIHGAPRDGLRVGALGWLMAHGSGAVVDGVRLTAMPLGITAVCAWAAWRIGHHVGDMVSGHGPDADRIADGERDWTVAAATACLVTGYLAVVLLAIRLAGAESGVSTIRTIPWTLLIAAGAGGPAIAVGSGRLAIWTQFLPGWVVVALATLRRVLLWLLAAALAAFLVALLVDFAAAANVLSQLDADAADSAIYAGSSLLVLPNIVLFAGSYLLGPGFTVGTATLVSPSAVVLGPLPLFPVLAALPDEGPVAGWTPWLVLVPLLVAGAAAHLTARRHEVARWHDAALVGGVGGVAAGLVFGVLAGVAGGSVGPGRMQHVSPYAFDSMLHAVVALGLGAMVGSLVATWQHRRALRA